MPRARVPEADVRRTNAYELELNRGWGYNNALELEPLHVERVSTESEILTGNLHGPVELDHARQHGHAGEMSTETRQVLLNIEAQSDAITCLLARHHGRQFHGFSTPMRRLYQRRKMTSIPTNAAIRT